MLGLIGSMYIAGAASTAKAQDEPSSWLELTVGGQMTLGLGRVCRREASDVVGCTGLGVAGFELSPRWRIDPHWAIGALAQLGWGGSDQESSALWRFTAEGRWLPFGSPFVAPWFGVDGGVALAVDELDGDELGGARTYRSAAPTLGAAVGVDFVVLRQLALGLELRGVLLAFGDSASGLQRAPAYETQMALSLALVGTFLAR
jgi:hypothetical protein